MQQVAAPGHRPYLTWLGLANLGKQELSALQQRLLNTFSLEAKLWPLLRTLKRDELLGLLHKLDWQSRRRSMGTLSKEQLLSSLQGLPHAVLLQLVKQLPQAGLKPIAFGKEQALGLLQSQAWPPQALLMALARLNPSTLARLAQQLSGGAGQNASFKAVWSVLFHAPQKQLLQALGTLNQQELTLLLLGLKASGQTLGEGASASALFGLLQNANKEDLLQALHQLPEHLQQAHLHSLPNEALAQLLEQTPPEVLLAYFIAQQPALL
jgi:hypothetical protein